MRLYEPNNLFVLHPRKSNVGGVNDLTNRYRHRLIDAV
jgi:hypothetical protein